MTKSFEEWHKHVTEAPMSDVLTDPNQIAAVVRMFAYDPKELTKLVPMSDELAVDLAKLMKGFADWLEGFGKWLTGAKKE